MLSLCRSRVLLFAIVLLGSVPAVRAQTTGSRDYRLRYQPLRWRVFSAPSFRLYYPEGGDSLAAFAARQWPEAVARVKATCDLPLPKDPQLLLYPSTTALYTSNVGTDLPATLALPTFIRKGNRLLVPYDGSYQSLDAGLRAAAARAAWDGAFLAADLGQQARGTANMAAGIPDWYREGTLAWIAQGWMPGTEDAWREAIAAHLSDSWAEIAAMVPMLAGSAFNHYLEQAFFPRAPQGVLSQVRAKDGSLARGQRLVTKQPLDTALARCLRWYRGRFDPAASGVDTTEKRNPSDSAAVGSVQ